MVALPNYNLPTAFLLIRNDARQITHDIPPSRAHTSTKLAEKLVMICSLAIIGALFEICPLLLRKGVIFIKRVAF